MKHHTFLLSLFALGLFFLASCGTNPSPTSAVPTVTAIAARATTAAPTETTPPTHTPTATAAYSPTSTPTQTFTPAPTKMPSASATDTPSATATAQSEWWQTKEGIRAKVQEFYDEGRIINKSKNDIDTFASILEVYLLNPEFERLARQEATNYYHIYNTNVPTFAKQVKNYDYSPTMVEIFDTLDLLAKKDKPVYFNFRNNNNGHVSTEYQHPLLIGEAVMDSVFDKRK